MSYLHCSDVLDIYVEPYIHSGFRLPNQPYSYYYRSLFSLHNETLSIWIHLVGTFIIVLQTFDHILSTSSPFVISYIIYNCIGACVMLLCSAQAHLFHSRNLNDHLRSFYIDYLGINFYGFISGIVHYRFSRVDSSYELFNEPFYYLFLSCLSLYSLSIACFSSGTIFVSKLPERFHPGTFDLIGQSHHTFHGFIFLMGFFQSGATYRDMLQMKNQITTRHLLKDITYACVTLTLEILIVYTCLKLSFTRLEKHYEKDLKKLNKHFNKNNENAINDKDEQNSIKKIE
ncbi:unnamed protein product [Didymodactylos carnosus]|uniref:Uncharacterized protein n=1 Tax=Didymodactylos carnosus TaxID=1234261 RepID=A0A814DED1_9BILA|nr:unnamed protein product [Didymodactylos carnosus]CAF3730022.1 unnamed protein product [Didymodactylos carnosus]